MTADLDRILACLDRHRVRASHDAVAEALGVDVKALLLELGRPQPCRSWIVNVQTGLPAGYPEEALHPGLMHAPLIASGAALRVFLAESGGLPPVQDAVTAPAPQRAPARR